MFIQTSVLLALVGTLAKLAVAVPPACLLAAVNTQDDPGNMELICGMAASDVMAAIDDLCGDDAEAAEEEFSRLCQANGQTMMSESSNSTSSTMSQSSTKTSASGSSSTSAADSEDDDSSDEDSDSNSSGPAVVAPMATGGSASPTGAYSPSGNGTIATSARATNPAAETSAPGSAFTGAGARSLAGSFVGVAVVAAGFIIVL